MAIQDQYETGEIEDMSKKSCIIYDSWGELIKNLPNEMAGELIKLILCYAFDGEYDPSSDPAIYAMFSMIKSKLDEDAEAYEEVKNMRSEAARKRWSESKAKQKDANACTCINEDANACSNMQKDAVSVSVSDSVSDKDKKDILSEAVSEIIDYLNEKAGTHYGKTTKQTVGHIKARLDEGFTVEDFKTVIDKKAKWKEDPMMCTYLRPETLFCPSHFESYLNEIEAPSEKPAQPTVYGKVHNFAERKVDYAALGAELINDQ